MHICQCILENIAYKIVVLREMSMAWKLQAKIFRQVLLNQTFSFQVKELVFNWGTKTASALFNNLHILHFYCRE